MEPSAAVPSNANRSTPPELLGPAAGTLDVPAKTALANEPLPALVNATAAPKPAPVSIVLLALSQAVIRLGGVMPHSTPSPFRLLCISCGK